MHTENPVLETVQSGVSPAPGWVDSSMFRTFQGVFGRSHSLIRTHVKEFKLGSWAWEGETPFSSAHTKARHSGSVPTDRGRTGRRSVLRLWHPTAEVHTPQELRCRCWPSKESGQLFFDIFTHTRCKSPRNGGSTRAASVPEPAPAHQNRLSSFLRSCSRVGHRRRCQRKEIYSLDARRVGTKKSAGERQQVCKQSRWIRFSSFRHFRGFEY